MGSRGNVRIYSPQLQWRKSSARRGEADLISGNVLLFYSLSMGGETEITCIHTLYSSAFPGISTAVASGKKGAANQGTTNHRQGFSVSIISRQRARAPGTWSYTYAHATSRQAFFLGLCSHQCVQLDRERGDGRNSWGSEVVQLSNYKLWGPQIFHDCISTASGVHRGGSVASPGKRPGGGRWWFEILMDVRAPTLPLGLLVQWFHHTPVEVGSGQSGPVGLLLALNTLRKVCFYITMIVKLVFIILSTWFYYTTVLCIMKEVFSLSNYISVFVRLKYTFGKQDQHRSLLSVIWPYAEYHDVSCNLMGTDSLASLTQPKILLPPRQTQSG